MCTVYFATNRKLKQTGTKTNFTGQFSSDGLANLRFGQAQVDRSRHSVSEVCLYEETPDLTGANVEASVRNGDWNDRPLDEVLDAVQDARRDLHDLLSGLDDETWMADAVMDDEKITLFELVHRFASADFQRLRNLGYRLHDADLSDRGEE